MPQADEELDLVAWVSEQPWRIPPRQHESYYNNKSNDDDSGGAIQSPPLRKNITINHSTNKIDFVKYTQKPGSRQRRFRASGGFAASVLRSLVGGRNSWPQCSALRPTVSNPPSRDRTCDRLLKRQLLYQLSYGRMLSVIQRTVRSIYSGRDLRLQRQYPFPICSPPKADHK